MIPALAQLQRPDYFVLVGYFVLMLGIGAYFYRHMQGMKDYFTGGNRIPWWLSGVSFYMSSFSGFTFLAYSALAYQYGWVAVTLFWVTVPATLVSAVFFSARWRRARLVSPVEYLETRFGPATRQLFAWEGIPVKLIDDVLKLIAIGTFISVVLNLEGSTMSILCSGLIILVYTFMGGLWAVTVTDFVQFIVMVAAAVILAYPVDGLDDSKRLTPARRERLFAAVTAGDHAYALSIVSPEAIDTHGIQTANYTAMNDAIARLDPQPDLALVDGFTIPGCAVPHLRIVKGDQRSCSIAAASIVASMLPPIECATTSILSAVARPGSSANSPCTSASSRFSGACGTGGPSPLQARPPSARQTDRS